MKKILIWGAGEKGKTAFDILSQYTQLYYVIGFGDNDRNKIGRKFCGKDIIGIGMIDKCESPDIILIASSAASMIKEQLSGIVSVPICDNLEQLVFTRLAIDISGFCNARCKWCVTGRRNFLEKKPGNVYMDFNSFIRLYEHLISTQIIVPKTEIMLYSWGEPLLNPDYVQIVEFLAGRTQTFSVSTNASKIQLVQKRDAYKYCCSFVFSMPGYSQESYDRVHGFRFERIKENIVRIYENIMEHGFIGDGSISFHVYRFNHNEIAYAKEFADSIGLRFNPYYPYFNGNSMAEEYLENRLDKAVQKEAIDELYLGHVKGLLQRRPAGYRCFLENIISINWNGNLTLCCAADAGLADYEWEHIGQITSFGQMREKRKQMLQCESCQKCRVLGIDYWMGNNLPYELN